MFFFNDTATTEIYTLSLHDALPIFLGRLVDAGDEARHPDVVQASAARARRAEVQVAAGGDGRRPLVGGARAQRRAEVTRRAPLARREPFGEPDVIGVASLDEDLAGVARDRSVGDPVNPR